MEELNLECPTEIKESLLKLIVSKKNSEKVSFIKLKILIEDVI